MTEQPEDPNAQRLSIIEKFRENPMLAHQVVFSKRHTHATPQFHFNIVADWWSSQEFVGVQAFREGAKSTLSEEAITLMACMGLEPFILIIGANYDRAVDRLTAIKHEIENNEILNELFGDMRGSMWNDGEVILKNGVKIQALGAGMKFRGVKYLNSRPMLLFIDDLEDEENTATEEKRTKLARWMSRVVFPACRRARKRIVGTPIRPDCWLETQRKNAGWKFHVYPIVTPATVDPETWEMPQWADRYPLDFIKKIRDEYERDGDLQGFVQEYLCRSEDEALKPFRESHIIPAPAIPSWAPSLVICDPARKGNAAKGASTKTARTGYAVVSWVGAKMYVRHAYGEYHQPSQIIDDLFKLDDTFHPVHIAIEKDGLEEFLMQPLRARQIERGYVLPIKPVMAPRDRNKAAFIKGLHPFFEAKDILMCGEFPQLRQEILNFPTGLNDILNCVAYGLRLRAGKPVYEDFGFAHVAPDQLRPHTSQPLWLVINAEQGYTTGVLVQYVNRALRVFGDWVKEGGVEDALEQLLPDALQLADNRPLRYFAPGEQFDQYNNLGLPAAARRLKLTQALTRGPLSETAANALTPLVRASSMMQPAFLISPNCRWTINGMSQGYARSLDKSGVLSPQPDPGYYATLLRGLESFAKWLTVRVEDTAESQSANFAYTPDGRRYMSARAGGGQDAGRSYKRPGFD